MSSDLPLIPQTLDYTCGAACFDSAYRYFHNTSPGEMFFAKELGTLDLGYTSPKNIVDLAKKYGFASELKLNSDLKDIINALQNRAVVFVTWWDEDSGHYSLVKTISDENITLMDPWTARDGKDNIISIKDFIFYWQERGSTMIVINLHK